MELLLSTYTTVEKWQLILVDHKKAEGLLEREDKVEVLKNKAIVLIKEISLVRIQQF